MVLLRAVVLSMHQWLRLVVLVQIRSGRLSKIFLLRLEADRQRLMAVRVELGDELIHWSGHLLDEAVFGLH